MTTRTPSPAETYDVIVAGSGAGGLAAAVAAAHRGLRVVVLERAAVCGGATAWSGGWIWAPGNPLARADGVREDTDEFRTYLNAVLGNDFHPARVDAFLAAAPEMVRFFHERTALKFVPGAKICDIYGDLPGAGTGHRSVAPAPVDLRELGDDVARLLRRQLYETSFLGLGIMAGDDLGGFLAASRGDVRGLLHATRRVSRHMFDLVTRRRGMQLVNGTALVGRLLRAALDAGVAIRTSARVSRLIRDGDTVAGVEASTPDGQLILIARRGVVLATGGFPRDENRRRAVFPHGEKHWTLAPETADGSGVALGESVGGRLRTDLRSPAAWCPVSLVPYATGRTGVFPHIMDRAKPGSIGVLRTGRRFVNEANGYYDYVSAMLAATPEGEPAEAWQIADARYVRRYPLGMVKPRPIPLFPYLRNGYLKRGRTLEELARTCGIDPAGLVDTVARFNAAARRGEDPEFGRGSTPFNRYGGDRSVGPNPSLAPLEKAPFYAVKVVPGSFGTFAGLGTDEASRVLDDEDQPIPGLYAVGCDQASVMGGHYPAGGINLGPALTFGWLAAQDLARAEVPA
ncbi:succinate dehydrogenase/fumarate reductase flavoprotein subunit [Amycolatopsis bartoniae]|uniref:FAD-binding dehydrogenase n=1 Tax=Amycolatopsis bartoniae TaxID=941986 RepID=A0A8H9MFF5_9PSEU|nr:FAD-dependent oxidoreductase [Amycolatopsis bartoniae]MBB2938422.1 succinate dehydrogenase/fumarate reductase flavoprotein subunit [Amycolatopsis bartoniae]TVT06086.1 FAD-dependent oxidoreductase [Amycolatopsis bartoniae]GHF71126.1 FAD-binding dehydrogenase [Amycolatopsis bartoniae]